ncbi:hypothetical protein PDL71_17020 [Lacibacter sp. MH-610]|uniref:hypothetical protein n=1 Tax=Lacibacter sp. MH-610 TaxID=3020883 RepID=UPI003891EB95
MRKLLKLIGINLLVLIGLILIADLTALILFSIQDARAAKKKQQLREEGITAITSLSAYKNVNWAKDQLKEELQQKFVYRSFVGWRKLAFEGRTIHVDSNGIRRTIQSEPGSDSAATVVFLGGSTMWGDNVHDSCTIPSYFSLLSKGKYRAVNFGEDSYCAYQGFLFLQMQLLQGLQPKIVVAYDGVNNAPGMVLRPFSHRREEQIAYHIDGADQKKPHPKFSDYYLKPTRELLRIAHQKIFSKEDLQPIETNTGTMSDSAAAIYLLDSWLAAKQLSNLYGAKFICVLQPNIYTGTPIISELKNPVRINYSYYKLIPGLLQTSKYESLKESFLDFTQLFNNREGIYIDFCHLGPEGNQTIAQQLLLHLEKRN